MKHLSKGRDKKIFSNSARRTRLLNIGRFIPRGGIRL